MFQWIKLTKKETLLLLLLYAKEKNGQRFFEKLSALGAVEGIANKNFTHKFARKKMLKLKKGKHEESNIYVYTYCTGIVLRN